MTTNKAVLITGAAGFIGFHLASNLAIAGNRVTIVDNFNETLYPNDEKYIRWNLLRDLPSIVSRKLDLNSLDFQEIVADQDVIVNCAAIPGLTKSWTAPDDYIRSNTQAVANLASAVGRINPTAKIIHLSTSSVYGENAIGSERINLSPSSPYGITKLSGERILEALAVQYDLDFSILRLFSVYGSWQRPDMGIRIFIDAILRGHEFGLTANGEHTRSFTHVQDVVGAILICMNYTGPEKIFNIGGGEQCSILELIAKIELLTGLEAKSIQMASRAGDQFNTKADFSLATSELGYNPRISLREGLLEQILWQKSLF